jgi:hypothetical protein
MLQVVTSKGSNNNIIINRKKKKKTNGFKLAATMYKIPIIPNPMSAS